MILYLSENNKERERLQSVGGGLASDLLPVWGVTYGLASWINTDIEGNLIWREKNEYRQSQAAL